MSRYTLNNRPAKRVWAIFLVLLVLGTAVLLGACEATETSNTPPESPGEETREGLDPLEASRLENGLYELMNASSDLDTVTEAWQEALAATQDPESKDRLTSRWLDFAKYRTSALSQALYSENGDTGSPLFVIYNTLFQRQWDPARIPDIEDPDLRRYFEVLDRSFMRMVEYGEYVGPGFDFERLSNLNTLSSGFQAYFTLSDHYYGFLAESYQTGLIPYNAFADYLLKLEDTLKATDSPYIKIHLEPLLRWSYGMFFSGTMGSGPFNYETNVLDPNFEDLLESIVERQPDSGLAALATQVMNLPEGTDESEYAYVDAVQNYKRFGLDSPKGIRTVYSYQHPVFYEARPELYGFEDTQVMASLSANLNSLLDQLKTQVQWGNNPDASYNLGYHLEFANDRWASFQLAASSYDPETGINLNFNEAAVFDLTTGARVTLDEFLGDETGEATNRIEALLIEQARQYMTLPEDLSVDLSQRFSLGEDYLLAMLPPRTLSEEQAYDLFVDLRYGLAFPEVDLRNRLLSIEEEAR
ncbi:hypothetical protein [Acidaminobacter hydrogenoformans]|uniref:Uncharacterized protein n=1 Tax=Acidaminobacter hydrogenoformans DSM 2784 TaxID=1120920 RepID=A0A1G5S8L4_9FIRM|nr:hypothetical protein [Acidaminobacter hydrogenoformans]SCZ81939.1 hypothetical protein SAMN03080599_03187 [Acidaminobacter hydrogenoformans DSM 2784]